MKIITMLLLICPALYASEIGRYQYITSSFRADSAIFDTVTGKIWKYSCHIRDPRNGIDCLYAAWEPDDVSGVNIKELEILEKAEKIKKLQEK